MTQILRAWEVSQQEGGSAARTTLLSSGGCLQDALDGAAARDCTTHGMGAKMEGLPPSPSPPPPPPQQQQQQQQTEKPVQGKDGSEPPPTLKLPQPNRFIPSEFHIKEVADAAPPSASASDEKVAAGAAVTAENGETGHLLNNKHSPRKVVRDTIGGAASGAVAMLTIWHLQDRTFRQPRAEIYLKVTRLLLMRRYCMRKGGVGWGG